MKRRDLLKTAGTMLLTAPAVRVSALVKSKAKPAPQSGVKTLIVTFSGAFCFWQETNGYKVMVPPLGDCENAHLPWAGTSANTKSLEGSDNFILTIGRATQHSASAPPFTGTEHFTYPQEQQRGNKQPVPPLLNLYVPFPDHAIGILPTGVKIICKGGNPEECKGTPGEPYPWCNKDMIYASGLAFVYQNVVLDDVWIKPDSGKGQGNYKACFTNDAILQEATLGIHLTPLKWVQDPGHKHAKYVWQQMLSMYPWMQDDIEGICFPEDFDPSSCPAGFHRPSRPIPGPCALPQVGPSTDCEVPIMVLPPPGGKSLKPNR